MSDKKHKNLLFDEAQLQEIRTHYQEWHKKKLKSEEKKEEAVHVTSSGIPVKLLHTPLDIKELDYLQDTGFPGAPPFVRGIYPNMYQGRPFTIRQLAGLGAPEDCNLRVKYLLDHGATGVSILFDLPTIRGYDSDDPEAEGNVGQCGAAVDSLVDMEAFFSGIDLGGISTSIVTHLPSTSLIIPGMYFALAEARGIPYTRLSGTCQNDFLMETVIGSAPEILPPAVSFRMQCDVVDWITRYLPRWNPISLNGYNLREAGTDAVAEVAIAIANAVATAEELVSRGREIDDFAPRISFFWDLHNDFFEEVAKCRASRKIWYRIMRERFKAKDPRSWLMRFHVQTAGITLPATEPLNNIARSALQGLAAVFGGAQSLHIDSFDEAYSAPTETAALVSLRTQQIIQQETGVTQTVDPLAGSYYLEYLTAELEKRIEAYIRRIEGQGGIVAAAEKGWLHREIASYQFEYQRKIESGEIKVVGVNAFQGSGTSQPIEVFEYPETESRQRVKLERLRRERDSGKIHKALDHLRGKCYSKENLYPYTLEAVKSLATLGEISELFRNEFGLWHSPLIS
jgi:methylmalonyl-CoA mutase N-terminal domain/subunit